MEIIEMVVQAYETGIIEKWLVAIGGVVLAARGITIMTPNKSDDKVVNALLQILNKLSLAVGKNKVEIIEKDKEHYL